MGNILIFCFLFQIFFDVSSAVSPTAPQQVSQEHATTKCPEKVEKINGPCILNYRATAENIKNSCKEENFNPERVLTDVENFLQAYEKVFEVSQKELSKHKKQLRNATVHDVNIALAAMSHIRMACAKNSEPIRKFVECLDDDHLQKNIHDKLTLDRSDTLRDELEKAIENCRNLEEDAQNLVSTTRTRRNWISERYEREKEKQDAKEYLKGLQKKIENLRKIVNDTISPKEKVLENRLSQTINSEITEVPSLAEEKSFILQILEARRLGNEIKKEMNGHEKLILNYNENKPEFDVLINQLQEIFVQNQQLLKKFIKNDVEKMLKYLIANHKRVLKKLETADQAERIVVKLNETIINLEEIGEALKDEPSEVGQDHEPLRDHILTLEREVVEGIKVAELKVGRLKKREKFVDYTKKKTIAKLVPAIAKQISRFKMKEATLTTKLSQQDPTSNKADENLKDIHIILKELLNVKQEFVDFKLKNQRVLSSIRIIFSSETDKDNKVSAKALILLKDLDNFLNPENDPIKHLVEKVEKIVGLLQKRYADTDAIALGAFTTDANQIKTHLNGMVKCLNDAKNSSVSQVTNYDEEIKTLSSLEEKCAIFLPILDSAKQDVQKRTEEENPKTEQTEKLKDMKEIEQEIENLLTERREAESAVLVKDLTNKVQQIEQTFEAYQSELKNLLEHGTENTGKLAPLADKIQELRQKAIQIKNNVLSLTISISSDIQLKSSNIKTVEEVKKLAVSPLLEGLDHSSEKNAAVKLLPRKISLPNLHLYSS